MVKNSFDMLDVQYDNPRPLEITGRKEIALSTW